MDKASELRLGGVHKAPALVLSEEPYDGRIDLSESSHRPPSGIRLGVPLGEGVVQRGLEDREDAVGGGAPSAHRVGIVVDLGELLILT